MEIIGLSENSQDLIKISTEFNMDILLNEVSHFN